MKPFEYKFTGINKSYAQQAVISDARIKLTRAQCSLLSGDNGAGKTTLLKILAGLESPDDSTRVMINGNDYTWRQGKSFLLKNIMYLHRQPCMFDGSVIKNLQYIVKVNRLAENRVFDALAWAGLEDVSRCQASRLSAGQQQRVALARAYLRSPDVILLDEPTANLDQASRLNTLELLRKFRDIGVALVIASHDADFFQEIQDEQLLISHSRLTKPELHSRGAVVENIQDYRPSMVP